MRSLLFSCALLVGCGGVDGGMTQTGEDGGVVTSEQSLDGLMSRQWPAEGVLTVTCPTATTTANLYGFANPGANGLMGYSLSIDGVPSIKGLSCSVQLQWDGSRWSNYATGACQLTHVVSNGSDCSSDYTYYGEVLATQWTTRAWPYWWIVDSYFTFYNECTYRVQLLLLQ